VPSSGWSFAAMLASADRGQHGGTLQQR